MGINTRAVLERVHALGVIGRGSQGGVTRLAYSPLDREAHGMLLGWMNELGLDARIDAVGNVFGTWHGAADAPLLIGSHIDTVPDGGIYDGSLGVAAAVEVIAALQRDGVRPPMPVQVVSFQMEESSRFGHATFGSKVFAGRLTAAEVATWRDNEGQSLAECLAANGLDLSRLNTARCTDVPRAYLELHIEQGIILREAGIEVGIVTGIAAPLRIRFTVIGEAAHSGAALPEQRKDALMAAGRILSHVEDLVEREREWGTIATIGFFRVSPNVMNVVPGQVEMGLDVRGVHIGSRQRLARAILHTAAQIASHRGLEIRISGVGDEVPTVLPDQMVALLESAAKEEKVSHQRIVSLAGHDAMQVASVAPAGMILVRNISGTSHSSSEWVAPEDVDAGCRVLYRAVRRLLETEGRA